MPNITNKIPITFVNVNFSVKNKYAKSIINILLKPFKIGIILLTLLFLSNLKYDN